MTRLVVDASVVVKWFVPEKLSAGARGILGPEYELLARRYRLLTADRRVLHEPKQESTANVWVAHADVMIAAVRTTANHATAIFIETLPG